jgi:hypothetical protein
MAGMGLVSGHTDVFGKGTIGAGACYPASYKIDTTVVIPLLTVKAGAAVQCRLYHHLLSNLPGGDLWAHRGNLPAELVPHNEAGRPGVRTVVKAIQVTTTDPSALHLDEYFTGLRLGIGNVGQTDVTRTMKDGCQHRLLSSP